MICILQEIPDSVLGSSEKADLETIVGELEGHCSAF